MLINPSEMGQGVGPTGGPDNKRHRSAASWRERPNTAGAHVW